MRLTIVPVTPLQQNCSILACTATGRAAIIDPGGEAERIASALSQLGVELEKILVTHGHADHAGGVVALRDRFDVPVEGPEPGDEPLLQALPLQGRMLGMHEAAAFTPTRWLREGDVVTVGEIVLDVFHCPGHTPGHVALHAAAERILLGGDLLFRGSIGRSDLPGGDRTALLRSLATKLLVLDDDVTVVPGHGPVTTIGEERRTNPFLTGL